jgi:hypothetical protein
MAEHVSFERGSSSSPSSGGVESNHGTPGTKVTEFSPEETRCEPKIDHKSSIKINNPPAFTLQSISAQVGTTSKGSAMGIQDPFTTSSNGLSVNASVNSGPKLSPTAATFKPGSLPVKLTVVNPTKPKLTNLNSVAGPSTPQQAAPPSSVSYLNATSVPDAVSMHCKPAVHVCVTGSTLQAPIGPPNITNATIMQPTNEPSFPQFLSATIGSSRYLKIGQVPKTTTHKELNSFFTVSS